MEWRVTEHTESKNFGVLSSLGGEWVATWGKSGLYRLQRKGSVPAEHLGVKIPVWLETAWGLFWEGKPFDGRLCIEKPPSLTTATVWRVVLHIPYGKTMTYGEVAARSGIPNGARAVGSIMRANPWSLFLPCHRVIGKGGQMCGYGGPSGVGLKEWLIEYEQRTAKK